MFNYQILNWKKLKTAVKDKTETTLRISLIMFNGNDLPHELSLTKRQKTKLHDKNQEMHLTTICQLI